MSDAFTPRSNETRVARTTLAVLAAAFAYAVLRYVVLGSVPAAQIPLYVANKAIAVTALMLLGLAVTGRSPEARRARGLVGAAFAILHVLLTVPLMTPAYFRGLFSGETLTAAAGLAVLIGGASLVALMSLLYPAARWSAVARTRLSLLVVALIGGHVLALGGPRWRVSLDRLPAISLLSFLYAASVLGACALGRVRARASRRVSPLAMDR